MTKFQPWIVGGALALALAANGTWSQGQETASATNLGEAAYQNHRLPRGPWSVHVIRIPRAKAGFEIRSLHASGRATGLASLSHQLRVLKPDLGTPVAAINGDFYRRDGEFAGDPRGLQIVEGEMISAPSGGASFWIDAVGEPHSTNTHSLLRVTWPNGKSTPMGLNGARRAGGVELYTPAIGKSTRTVRGREFVLEPSGDDKKDWLPLRPGRVYHARVKTVSETGNTPLSSDIMVLSVGPSAARSLPAIEPGAELVLSTETRPNLRGVKTAISGGPVLVQDGKRQKLTDGDSDTDSDSYQASSMWERHPRSAVGWNDEWVFLVEVDGRQQSSVGMTLNELSAYLVQLGCQGGMNLDGGGSATLWYNGAVRNRPCDGRERPVANSLVVTKKGGLASSGNGQPAGDDAADP